MRAKPFYTILGAFVVFIALAVIAVVFFSTRSHNVTVVPKNVVLADYAESNAVVSFEQDGATKGNELHRSIKITISRDSREFAVLSDYQGNAITRKSYPNNGSSFKAFLAGLQAAGYLKERKSALGDNYLGQCPLGIRFIYKNDNFKDVPALLWSTSCATSSGTSGGSSTILQQLFKNQIPEYNKMVVGVQLL
jgi:hypothetical protein